MAVARKVKGTAGTVLAARIREQVDQITELDRAVRADEADAVHRMRVASRRLRSALRSYRGLLDGDPAPVVEELRWFGGALGHARDSEVLAERLLAQARDLPADGGRDAVVADLTRWAERQQRQARPEVMAVLDSPRYQLLVETLAELAADPPLGPRAERPAGPELTRTLRRERRRTDDRIRAARSAEPGEAVESALHAARKAAKRARYAGEAAGPAASDFTERMKTLQDLLGRHQDAVVAAAEVRVLSDGGFGYGVLYGRQVEEAAQIRAQLPEAWRAVKGKPQRLR
ncbi:hypothetical protein GCM10010441_60290 [Kitasatospora paracochleata]